MGTSALSREVCGHCNLRPAPAASKKTAPRQRKSGPTRGLEGSSQPRQLRNVSDGAHRRLPTRSAADYACWTLKPEVWTIFGMDWMVAQAEREVAFESGQYLIDKEGPLRARAADGPLVRRALRLCVPRRLRRQGMLPPGVALPGDRVRDAAQGPWLEPAHHRAVRLHRPDRLSAPLPGQVASGRQPPQQLAGQRGAVLQPRGRPAQALGRRPLAQSRSDARGARGHRGADGQAVSLPPRRP